MRMRRTMLAGVALAAACGTAQAGTNDVLIGLDSKVEYHDQGQVNIQPGTDKVLVMDVSNPGHPKIRGSLDLSNSLFGPPTNLQVTPDGKLGLVASSVTNSKDGDTWKALPDDKLFVIDLSANPPKLADTVTVGKQPSGLAIAKQGNLALVANRAGKGVSVLQIGDAGVKRLRDVDLGQDAVAVAITPDGKRAFVALNVVNKVAVLDIDGQNVTYDKANDMPVAFSPYNVAPTPDGRYMIVSCNGAGGKNADEIAIIEASGPHPHIVDLTTVGNGSEGMAVSPDGKWLLVPLLLGTGAKPSDWFFTRTGEAVLAALGRDGRLAVKDRKPLGALPEGVAWSHDSQWLYVGNYIDKNLQVFHVAGGKLQQVGNPIALPGQPASLRGVAP